MSFANVRLAGTAGILFLGYVLPFYFPPLASFVFEVVALVAWLLICLQWMGPVNLQSVSMRLAMLVVVIPMVSIALNLVIGRFGAWQLSVMAVFFLMVALTCALSGWCLVQACYQHGQHRRMAVKTCVALMYALLAAAVFNAVVAVFQYLQLPLNAFFPVGLTDAGRMFGNLRQPNQFALFMVWGILTALGLWTHHLKGETDNTQSAIKNSQVAVVRVKQLLVVGGIALLSVAVAMSSSRMGIGLMWAVAGACWFCPGLPKQARLLALFAACTHGLAWQVLAVVAENGGPPFYAALRGVSGLATDSRYALWADGIALITQSPHNALWGIGYGLTNFALNDGGFSGLMKTNNMHNIFLQMAVEFGLIVAALWTLVVLLLAARLLPLYRSAKGCLLMLGIFVIFLHSCLEYPLWYAHFLLPTAFALGCLVSLSTPAQINHPGTSIASIRLIKRLLPFLLWVMLLVPVAAAFDYRHVVPMYTHMNDVSLMARVEQAYRSVWYRYLADFGAFTSVPVTRESAATHYSLGLRVRAFDYNEQVAFQFLMAAAHLDKWGEAGIILRRLQRLHPKDVLERADKLTPAARVVYQELVLREGFKN